MHGLDGHPKETWSIEGAESWFDWLPAEFPSVNVWSLKYRLDGRRRGGSIPLTDRANNVLATLHSQLSTRRPVVFICHSYGGLLLKQMLRNARDIAPEYRDFTDRIKGIVFLATPHNGASIAQYIARVGVLRSAEAISELQQNAGTLRELSQWFVNNFSSLKLRVRVYFETMPTRGAGLIVDQSSANPYLSGVIPIGIDADHVEICKPPVRDVRVRQTFAMISDILSEQPPRFEEEKRSFIQRALLAANEEELSDLKADVEAALRKNPEDTVARKALRHVTRMLEAPEELAHVAYQRAERVVLATRYAAIMAIATVAFAAAAIVGFYPEILVLISASVELMKNIFK